MRSASQNETCILLDTNILVDFALDVIQEQLSEEERAAAEFARKLVLLSDCKLLIPGIAVSVEFPRFLTRGARTPRDE
jgi:predicted nucleic-acid-binding protein